MVNPVIGFILGPQLRCDVADTIANVAMDWLHGMKG